MRGFICVFQVAVVLLSISNISRGHVFQPMHSGKVDRDVDLVRATDFLNSLEGTYKGEHRDMYPRRRYPLYIPDRTDKGQRSRFTDDYTLGDDLDKHMTNNELEEILQYLDGDDTDSKPEIYQNTYEESEDRPNGFWKEIEEGDFMQDEKLRQLLLMTALLEDSIDEDRYKDDNGWPGSRKIEEDENDSKGTDQVLDEGGKLETKIVEDEMDDKPESDRIPLDSDTPTSDGKKERGDRILNSEFLSEHETAGKDANKAVKQRGEPDYGQNDVNELKALLNEMVDNSPSKQPEEEADNNDVAKQSGSLNNVTIDIKMPGIAINQDDTYLCTTVKIAGNGTSPLYIVEYIPHAKQTVAHHMLMYGCTSPGMASTAVWDCGGNMAEPHSGKSPFPSASVCSESSPETILWAWAKDAPKFVLPESVGFKAGTGTNIKYLVIQVHYKSAKIFRGGFRDYSGVSVVASKIPKPRLAGVYVLASSSGTIYPHQTEDLDIMCRYKQKFPIHPFAFRTHTHALGKLVMGFRVRDRDWTLIGAKNPQLPEAFYPILDKNMTVRYNDWLTARCVMHNFRNVPTRIGYRHTDEMCNFYIMFWVDSIFETQMNSWGKSCSSGYPWIHWSSLFSRYD